MDAVAAARNENQRVERRSVLILGKLALTTAPAVNPELTSAYFAISSESVSLLF
jgi:hypothetical protein